MLKLQKQQVEYMAAASQDAFIEKVARHLEETCRTTFPESDIAFDTHEARERLRAEMRYVLAHNFSSEIDVAAAIELFELHDVAINAPNTRSVVENEGLTVPEKLERLWKLGAGAEPR